MENTSASKPILPVKKRHLLLANAIIWGAPGIKILITGVQAYLSLWPSKKIIFLAIGTVLVLAGFTAMFSRIVKKYSDRITGFPEEKKSVFAFLSTKGYILIIFMMCLGISLKFIPGVPTEFFASFYCGLGPALIVAAAKFFSAWIEEGKKASDK
ncbi:MAG: hypothetical protein IJ202_02925 [Bacteroidales bacterium]|nr:hypothetical protein [Bacteroidales bacterium]